jgi:hypothetical protein
MAVPVVPLIAAGVSALASWLGSRKTAGAQQDATAASQPYLDALTDLIRKQQQRITSTDPVHQALVQMAYRRLPIYARAGIGAPGAQAAPHVPRTSIPETPNPGRDLPGGTDEYPTGAAQAIRNDRAGRSGRTRFDY